MKLTEPEWLIMNTLWDKHPAKARDVVERLPSTVNWAYTTVKTMLDRLVEKKAVGKSKRGNIGLYEPLVSRRQARRTAMKIMLDQAFDGAFGPMMYFLLEDESLSAGERKELIKILSGKSRKKGEQK
ncbi:MAG TPA: BlaI/MecI/CopY family transcriptional regulator [Sedimentisphaerales bacterium]|nr:BlaI/MecI/CopY family transcriptional regulator [Sedimentisphaerales bacterium]